MSLFRLGIRNLLRHRLRSLLTVGALAVALFLTCALRSLVTTLESGIDAASSKRLIVQSAVSLFVDFPLSYQSKIDQVPGVARTCKWQWFGGYYREESNYFGQFAVDPETMFDIYPEFAIVEGTREAFTKNRRGCFIGDGLSQKFGWKIGDTVPLIGTFFPHPDGPDKAWEFQVEAIYHPTQRNFDAHAMFFHWDYFEEMLKQTEVGVSGIGTLVIDVAKDASPLEVSSAVDALFANGPRVVQTTSEAEFQTQFVSMMGNIPFLLTSIGGAVLAGILLACLNTMLMAAREQTRDVGVLKALGFDDGKVFVLLLGQSLVLCCVGGGLGVLLAVGFAPVIADLMGQFFPGYAVARETVIAGLCITVGLGLIAGIAPALRARRLRVVEAIRATE